VVIRGREPYVLAAELAGFSSDLEVLAPATVREALVSIGRELVARYGE
jgi:predicted DNA-binding transcriptional regulator YafY